MTARHYPSLDGLRTVAVGLVLVSHAGAPFPRSGSVGVDIFFTLSGFLITSLLLREFETYRSISLRNFYVRRFLRLMPALWLTVAFMLVSVWALGIRAVWPARDAAFALTYVMNWARVLGVSGRVTLANGYIVDSPLAHTWSLAIEEQYYLLWPIVIGFICHRVAAPKSRTWTLLGLFGIVVVYRAACVGFYSAGRIYFGLDTHADGLVLGSAVAAALVAYPAIWSERGHGTRVCLTVLALSALVAVMALWTWPDAMMGWVGYTICSVASAVLILECVSQGTSELQSVLSHPLLVWLGRISYGLYLWHLPVYFVIRHWQTIWNWERVLAVGGSVTLALASASYYLVEARFLRLKGRYVRASAPISGSTQMAELPMCQAFERDRIEIGSGRCPDRVWNR